MRLSEVVVAVAKVHAVAAAPTNRASDSNDFIVCCCVMLVLRVLSFVLRYLGRYHKKVCLSHKHNYKSAYIQPRLMVEATPSVSHCRVAISVSKSSC